MYLYFGLSCYRYAKNNEPFIFKDNRFVVFMNLFFSMAAASDSGFDRPERSRPETSSFARFKLYPFKKSSSYPGLLS